MSLEIISMARQAGKTTKVVELAIENQYEILAANQWEKQRLLKTYSDLKPDQVFTWDELKARKGIRHYYGTVIDNADWILGNLMPSKLRAITITDFEAAPQQSKERSSDEKDAI